MSEVTEHHQVPHLENPFEEKAMMDEEYNDAVGVSSDDVESKVASADDVSSQSRLRGSNGNKKGDITRIGSRTPANTLEENVNDAVDEDELNFISTNGPDVDQMRPDTGVVERETKEVDSDHGLTRTEMDVNGHVRAQLEPQMQSKSWEHKKASEDEPANREHQSELFGGPGKMNMDDEAVQDALIQAAEDAMRYAYEESSRKNQASGRSFEQHQISELVVRQKLELIRLQEVEQQLSTIEYQLNKILARLPNSTGASPALALPTEGCSSEPGEIRSTFTSPELEGVVPHGNSILNWLARVPVVKEGSDLAKRVISLVRSRLRTVLDNTYARLPSSTGQISLSNIRTSLLETVSELVGRIKARLRQAAGMVLPEDHRGLRHVYEGFEDRLMAAAVVSAFVLTYALVRARRRWIEARTVPLMVPISSESSIRGRFVTIAVT